MRSLAEKPWAVALLLAVLVGLTQTGSLIHEVIDWDEATFMTMASLLLDGDLPYVAAFDNKPPMMFFLLAGVMALFGETLLVVRLFGDACILVTALLVVAVARRFTAPWPAVLAGIFYVALLSPYEGQYTSTELPATVFLMAALWCLLLPGGRPWAAFACGVFVSLAVLTRTNLVYVAVAIGFYLAAAALLRPPRRARLAGLGLYVAGGLLPLAAFLLLYGWHNALDVFFLSTVGVALTYATGQSTMLETLSQNVWMWKDRLLDGYPVLYGSVTIGLLGGGAVVLWRSVRAAEDPARIWTGAAVVVTLLGVLLSILGSGTAYHHYWLQAMPFAALLCGLFFDALRPVPLLAWVGPVVAAVAMLNAVWLTLPSLGALLRSSDVAQDFKPARRAADRIAGVLGEDDAIWAPYYHIVPWYLGEPPVTWMAAHPDNIARQPILDALVAAGRVPPDILARVMESRPAFIVTNGTLALPDFLPRPAFDDYLAENYGEFFRDGDVVVWRRLGHGGWQADVPFRAFPDPS